MDINSSVEVTYKTTLFKCKLCGKSYFKYYLLYQPASILSRSTKQLHKTNDRSFFSNTQVSFLFFLKPT